MRSRGTPTGRQRARAQARAALNRPTLPAVPDAPVRAPTPALRDWPRVPHRHDTWWQVSRVEVRDGVRVHVLVHETPDEERAFKVAYAQRSQAVITRWRDRRPPHVTPREPLVVACDVPGTGGDELC